MDVARIRTNSPAHQVICRLVDLGGTASLQRLIDVLAPENQRVNIVQNKIIKPLLGKGYAMLLDSKTLKATDIGKDYAGQFLGKSLPRVETWVGATAQARSPRPFKPLDLQKLNSSRPVVYREGAFDYKEIPSMMGGARVLNGEVTE